MTNKSFRAYRNCNAMYTKQAYIVVVDDDAAGGLAPTTKIALRKICAELTF